MIHLSLKGDQVQLLGHNQEAYKNEKDAFSSEDGIESWQPSLHRPEVQSARWPWIQLEHMVLPAPTRQVLSSTT